MTAGTLMAGSGVWAVVVAAGEGRRFGGAKQFSVLGGARVVDWAVRGAALRSEGVVVVVPRARMSGTDAWTPSVRSLLPAGQSRETEFVVVAGGASRSESVRCGLARVPDEAEVVLIHDGARPLADDGVFARVITAVREGADAAIPVVDVTDTIRWRHGANADRSQLVAVQTPQGFRAGALRAAHADGAEATDDSSLVEAVGGTVVTVDGDSRNLKITAPHDLLVAEALLALGEAGGDARDAEDTEDAGGGRV